MKCPHCGEKIFRCPECGGILEKRRNRTLKGGKRAVYFDCKSCGAEWRLKV